MIEYNIETRALQSKMVVYKHRDKATVKRCHKLTVQ